MIVIAKSQQLMSNQALAVTHALLQLALLIFWIRQPSFQAMGIVLVAILNLAAGISIVPLSYIEHSRSVRPSAVLEVYLIISTLLDLRQVRTVFPIEPKSHISAVLLTDICCKVALLALEARGKTSYLRAQYQTLSPESLSGVINSSFLWWLKGIFSAQYLDFFDRYHLDPALATESAGKEMQTAWGERSTSSGSLSRRR